MKAIPVNWGYGIPFGLLYSKEPSEKVKRLLRAIKEIKKNRKRTNTTYNL